MEKLAQYISERLAERNSCTIFQSETSRVWPLKATGVKKRNDAIYAFAEERGWSAHIFDPGIRVKFKMLHSGISKQPAS